MGEEEAWRRRGYPDTRISWRDLAVGVMKSGGGVLCISVLQLVVGLGLLIIYEVSTPFASLAFPVSQGAARR